MAVGDLRAVAYEHLDAVLLTGEVQQEYVRRYGSPDESPIEPGHFAAPDGAFAIAYVDDVPVGMGGWRRRVLVEPGGPAAEIKRMYVREATRGRGVARALLAWLEDSARRTGLRRMVLETGQVQPEALALYRSSGYTDIPAYGYYADSDLSVYLGKLL